MSDKQDHADWVSKKRLERSGIDLKPPAVRLHGRNESAKHAVMKLLVAREIQRRGRKWDTEVNVGDGRVDVLDLGEPDEPPVAYEIQTGLTPSARRSKARLYCQGTPIRDVLFLDPEEAPAALPGLVAYVAERVVG